MILLFIGVAFVTVSYVLPFILPFVLALMLAAVIEPVVRFLIKNAKISRGLAVGLVLCVVCGALLTLLGLGLSRLVGELVKLSGSLPQYYEQAARTANEITKVISDLTSSLPEPVQELLKQQVSRLYVALERIVSAVLDTLKGLPSLLGVLVITLIATFFVSRDREMLLKMLEKTLPGMSGGKMDQARREVLESTMGLLKAEMVLVGITTVIVIIALWLMGYEYALVMGLVTGMLDILPVLGPGLVFIPWAIYNLVFGSVLRGVLLLGLYGGISAVRQVLEAKIVGDRTGLHPLATLFAMYLGVRLFGAVGILLGPLMAIIFKAIVRAGLLPIWPPDSPAA